MTITGGCRCGAVRYKIDAKRRVSAYIAGELGEDVPVAARIGRAAVNPANEEILAIANPAPSRGLCKPCGTGGNSPVSTSFSGI